MARGPNDRVDSGDPTSEVPEHTGALNPPPPWRTPSTLAARLVPIVDRIRELNSRLGIRPYRTFLVHGQWTGTRRGFGQLVVTSRREIVPVPRVRDMNQVSMRIKATGRTEEGSVYIDQISARIPEDDLIGRTPDVQDVVQPRTSNPLAEFWWEIEEARSTIPNPAIRRFVPSGVPMLSRDGFNWAVVLNKQDYDRGRDGSTRQPA